MLAILLATLVGGCDPHPCAGTCDAIAVAADRAGDGATDCGVAAVGGDRSAVDACMSAEFTAGRPFFGLVETAATSADAVLIRGFARDEGGVLREVLGTRQGLRTVVHTRLCFSATAVPVVNCSESMDGLFLECDCTSEVAADAGNSPG